MLNALKFTLAVPGAQILSEGMTQAEVLAAMEQLRQQNGATGQDAISAQAAPLMQTAARRLSQEAALSSSNGDAGSVANPAAARRVSAEAAATAALLQEASHMSKISTEQQQRCEGSQDEAEPLDVHAAVSLAEACAQVRTHEIC